jgi:hypothetical protein
MKFLTQTHPYITVILLAVTGSTLYWLTTSASDTSQLVAGLLIAVTFLVWGEILIKKQGLTDFSAKAARTAFAIAALVVATIGISQIWSGNWPSFGWVTLAYNYLMPTDFGHAVIGLAVTLLTVIILYGAGKDAWSGSGKITIKMWRAAFATLVGFAFLFWLIGTSRMGQVGDAMQGVARTQLDALLAGQPINFKIDMGYFSLGFLGLAFLAGLWKMKIIQAATMLTGAVIWLPFIAWLAWGSLPADFKDDVSGALGAANEAVNPFVGETRYVVLQSNRAGQDIPVTLGPNDNLRISVPMGGFKPCIDASVAWKSNHGNASWFDPRAFGHLTGQGQVQHLTLSETLKAGMQSNDVPGIDLMVTLVHHSSGACQAQ